MASERSGSGGGARLEVDEPARRLGERFAEAGFRLYLVGGSVRDQMLGRPSPDVDLTTDARPEETLRVLQDWPGRRYLQGVRFGTVGLATHGRRVEITTFRKEIYGRDSRRPIVTFSSEIEVDLSRRDFTVNAMALRLPGGEFVDPFGGVRDLAAGRLDTPLDPEVSFGDDPLRMLRAARFAASLELVPARRVVAAMRMMADRLEIVSAERIQGELSRLLVAAKPALGLELAVSTGLADRFLPELPALRLEQDPVHRHKDVLKHTMVVVEKCEPDLVLRLAALLHDVGKPATRRIGPDGVSFHHHEVEGARLARERLGALRYSNRVIDDVTKLVEMHLRFHSFKDGWTDAALRRYIRDAGPLLDRLDHLVRADCTTRNPARARELAALQDDLELRIARLVEREGLDQMRPPIDGREVMEHLGIEPGPAVGRALDHLKEIRIERGPIDKAEAFELLDAWAAEQGIR